LQESHNESLEIFHLGEDSVPEKQPRKRRCKWIPHWQAHGSLGWAFVHSL